jgi:hypothetical protein
MVNAKRRYGRRTSYAAGYGRSYGRRKKSEFDKLLKDLKEGRRILSEASKNPTPENINEARGFVQRVLEANRKEEEGSHKSKPRRPYRNVEK